MGYQKLTPGQEEQILKMSNDGKSNEEIAEYFKNTYKVKLEPWKVSYIKGKVEKNLRGGIPQGGVATSEKKRRNAAQRKYIAKKKQPVAAPSGDNIINLVEQLRAELDAYSKYIIGKIRIELVKAVGEARKKRIDAGEDVPEFKEVEEA